jgi:hypothetical protein
LKLCRRRISCRDRPIHRLGGQALGVAREQGRLADVVQATEEHHHALQADAGAAMRRRAVLEGVDVGLDRVQRDSPPRGALWRISEDEDGD